MTKHVEKARGGGLGTSLVTHRYSHNRIINFYYNVQLVQLKVMAGHILQFLLFHAVVYHICHS